MQPSLSRAQSTWFPLPDSPFLLSGAPPTLFVHTLSLGSSEAVLSPWGQVVAKKHITFLRGDITLGVSCFFLAEPKDCESCKAEYGLSFSLGIPSAPRERLGSQ